MTKKGYKQLILNCLNNEKQFELLAENLVQMDEAKQILRGKGYGYTGMSLLETVKEIPDNEIWGEDIIECTTL